MAVVAEVAAVGNLVPMSNFRACRLRVESCDPHHYGVGVVAVITCIVSVNLSEDALSHLESLAM